MASSCSCPAGRARRVRNAIILGTLLALALVGGPALAQSGQGSGTPSQAEMRLRLELMQRSLGFGGIFGPALRDWVDTPPRDDGCGPYTDYAACQAHRAGDDWAAERLQQRRSTGAERDWYSR
jgi:hypothetical protein